MSRMWQSKLPTSVGVLGLTLYAIQSYYDHAGHRDLRPCGLSTRIGRPYTPHSHVYEMLNNTKKNTKPSVLHAKKSLIKSATVSTSSRATAHPCPKLPIINVRC